MVRRVLDEWILGPVQELELRAVSSATDAWSLATRVNPSLESGHLRQDPFQCRTHRMLCFLVQEHPVPDLIDPRLAATERQDPDGGLLAPTTKPNRATY